MPKFKHGMKINHPHSRKGTNGRTKNEKKAPKYLMVTAGPQRGRYVHDLIAEARLGRRLEGDETVEHQDGNGLNVDPENLMVVTKGFNSHLRWQRERRERHKEEQIPWNNQF